jgi:purine nucleoside permease
MGTALDERQRPFHDFGGGGCCLSAGAHFLAHTGRVDRSRALDLRTGSDFSIPPKGTSSADFLKSEATGNYAGFGEAIENAYRVGSPVVRELVQNWQIYRDKTPTAKQ